MKNINFQKKILIQFDNNMYFVERCEASSRKFCQKKNRKLSKKQKNLISMYPEMRQFLLNRGGPVI